MKVLTTSSDISRELVRLIEDCDSCQAAVAWASIGFEAYALLVRHASKITRMIVGTHFFQTSPKFIETFLTHPGVKFILRSDGVFHPKLYLFSKTDGEWECLIGSPNFTSGGFGPNDEMAVLISNRDTNALEAFDNMKARLDAYWAKASPVSTPDLTRYQDAWKRKQPLINSLRQRFGDPQKDDNGDGGKNPMEARICRMTWPEYLQQVKNEKEHPPHGHSFEGRLRVIREAKKLFSDKETFSQIDPSGRRKIAGLVKPVKADETNFLWFGSMRGSGFFQQAVKDKPEKLSFALDLIPAVGPVSREAYSAYIHHFRQAIPERTLIAPATRLLAIKRPDYFVCLDARNKAGLCKAFRIKPSVGYEEYWDSIIERIKEAAWWNSLPPAPSPERELWEARAAFLDSLYYDGKDMPSA
jgi:HKD family nuclease